MEQIFQQLYPQAIIVIARYSASIEKREIIACLFVFQEIEKNQEKCKDR